MNEQVSAHTEQPAAAVVDEPQDSLIVFFGIGLVLNLALITAFFVWARKQGKKRRQQRERQTR